MGRKKHSEKSHANSAVKKTVKGTAAAVVAASLLTGAAFTTPDEITGDQSEASYRSAPIVMELEEFVNTPVDDSEDDADEEKSSKQGFFARFRQAVLSLPQAARIAVITPLWLIGTALMTLISFLWNVIFATPVGAFIASFAMGLLAILGLFTATAHVLFPDIPVRKLLNKRNIIILACTALALSVFDAVAPMYWRSYPLASALIKLTAGASVIALLTRRAKQHLLGV